jgi:hypothetical protein
MQKLVQLEKIIEERIASLKEEVEIATNVRLSSLYIDNLRDEIQFLQWTTGVIEPIMNHFNQQPDRSGTTKQRRELEDIIKFEKILGDRIQELNLKLKASVLLVH